MAQEPSLVISLAAEFVGKKAFQSAETSAEKLGKTVKNLAKAIGLTFSVGAVVSFAKASVQAAAADEKAQKQLALALNNVGLGRDAASAESYIQKLQSEFGIVDDKLRPAYQKLAIATRSSSESQKLLSLALDLSAGTGKDLDAVTSALSKAYLGNNTALGKLGVGISKADLKTKSFNDITNDLAKTFKGAAASAANTFSGSIAKLGVASANVKEIIGKGIIDALSMLSDDHTVDDLAKSMESLATYTANVIRGLSGIAAELKNIKAAVPSWLIDIGNFTNKLTPFGQTLDALKGISEYGAKLQRITDYAKQLNPVQKGIYLNQVKITKLTKEQAAANAKILADKKSTAILDNANAALSKGNDVFNIEAIQLQAATIAATEQLGKVTNQAQLLSITNDLARLKVKQDIASLEDAIASKDEKRIVAATNRLNADLGVLGALTNQNLKLVDIKSILDTLLPKDLINLKNLDDAIAKLKAIATGFGTTANGSTTGFGTTATSNGSTYGAGNVLTSRPTKESIAAAIAAVAGTQVSSQYDPRVLYGQGRKNMGGGSDNYNADMAYAMSAAGRAATIASFGNGGGSQNVTVTIVDNTSGLIEVVQNAVQQNNRYGNNLDYAGAI